MTSLLTCTVAVACACNVLHVAGLHLQSGPALGNSAGAFPWHSKPESGFTPEDEFNRFLETHEDPIHNAPSGATGSMNAPSGNYGPILVVYLTYNGATAVKTLAQVQGLFWDSPGLKEAWYESSWGQVDLQTSDVDFFEMESPVDPATFSGLTSIYNAISASPTYQAQYATRSYTNTMVIYPGTTFSASAYVPGTWSQYQGNSITWQTFFHEIGHNWGLHHAGGYNSDGSYEQYLDDAVMGYQRTYRYSDPHAVTRYRLGWLTGAEVKEFIRGSDYQATDLSPLNIGPNGPGFLMVKIPCDECVGQMASVTGRGALYLSFRVDATGSNYGVEYGDNIRCYDKFLVPNAGSYLVLTDRVHLHFQANVNEKTELWTTMAAGDTQYIAESTMWIHVCSLDAATYAKVSVSDTSEASAIAGCSAAPTPAPPPTPPPCGWYEVPPGSCPCTDSSVGGCNLGECYDGMSHGEMCEADQPLPDGNANYNINNCPNGYDLWQYYCPPPTPAPPVVAVGDPHLMNVYGERFDVMRQGKVVLIEIPRGMLVENALLVVEADVRRLGGCSDMYFQRLNITGVWADKAHTGGLAFDAETVRESRAGWSKFGPLELKVVHGRTQNGLPYLNFYVKHLGNAGFDVGGLLGHDDHTQVATPEDECRKTLALSKDGSGGHPVRRSVAMASAA